MAQSFTSKNLPVDPKEILTVTMAKVFTAALLITVDSERSSDTVLYNRKLCRYSSHRQAMKYQEGIKMT